MKRRRAGSSVSQKKWSYWFEVSIFLIYIHVYMFIYIYNPQLLWETLGYDCICYKCAIPTHVFAKIHQNMLFYAVVFVCSLVHFQIVAQSSTELLLKRLISSSSTSNWPMFMFKPSLTCGVFLSLPPQRKVLPGLFGLAAEELGEEDRKMRGGWWQGKGVVCELGQCSLNFKEGM